MIDGILQDTTTNEQDSATKPVSAALRRLVRLAHGLSIRGRSVHPYHVCFDAGLLAIAGFVPVYAGLVHPISVPKFAVVILATALSYELLFLEVKARLFDVHSRSYLQDLFTFVLPVSFGCARLLGMDLSAVADVIGLQLALLLGFVRLGCFFGGCCYGVPSRYGIEYPSEVFEPHDGSCQSFSPGEDPGRRVFPIQLVSSAVSFALFGALFVQSVRFGADGLTLPLYVGAYAVYRFFSDFYRMSSARPDWWRLSEAQWISMAVVCSLVVGVLLFPNVV